MAATLRVGGQFKPAAILHLSFRRCSTLSSSSSSEPSHQKSHSQNQVYLSPTPFIGSWEAPTDPRAAKAQLAQLRRDYAKQVKEVRKQYANEVEAQRQEQLRKDEARREEVLRQREERKKAKTAAAQARAAQRKALEDNFRQTLIKEKAEKLEYWRMREKAIEEKRNEKKEIILKQSSSWIDEANLGETILQRIVDGKNYL